MTFNDNGNQGEIIPPHKWATGSSPDDNLYSLNVGRVMELVWDAETGGIIDSTPESVAAMSSGEMDLPDFAPQSGTYTEISKEAARLNKAQQNSGFSVFQFFPHPIQKLAA